MNIPDEAVQVALDVPVVGGRENYIRSILTAAAPFLQGVKVDSEKIEAARNAVEELANTHMCLTLEDWSRISSTILSALAPYPRAQALEEGDNICARLEGLASWLDGSQHSKWCGRKEVPIHGYSGEGKLVRAAIAAIRALSSQPVADGEYEIDYEVICNGDFVAGSSDLADAKHYAAVYAQDGPVEIIEARTYRRPLPASPGASE